MADFSVMERAFVNSVSNERLQLIILPTEKCNFRCVYCYEDFAVGRMPHTVVGGVKKLLSARVPTLSQLTIMWFGGEPLLAENVITEISQHILALQAAHPRLKYNASATTNGALLDLDRTERLLALGISDYQVSLDGPQRHHDRTRIALNRKGTFDVIWGNLAAIRDSGIDARVMIRLHLTPENLPDMPTFVAEIRDQFLGDPRFSMLLMPVARLGGAQDESLSVIPHDETRAIIGQLMAIARPQGMLVNRDPANLACGPCENDVCYASKPNSLVIRANGQLAKCTVGFDAPVNNVGQLRSDGTLELSHNRLKQWFGGWQAQDWAKLSCPKDAFEAAELAES